MVQETILQHWIFSKFILPFLLVFFIVFAVLEKTKIFGENKQQLDALVSFVIALVFVSAVFPKLVVGNLILFLTVALIVVFVVLLLWGFITGGEAKFDSKPVKIGAGILAIIAVAIVAILSSGINLPVIDFLFNQEWSGAFWTNLLFIVVIAAAIALVLKSGKNSGG